MGSWKSALAPWEPQQMWKELLPQCCCALGMDEKREGGKVTAFFGCHFSRLWCGSGRCGQWQGQGQTGKIISSPWITGLGTGWDILGDAHLACCAPGDTGAKLCKQSLLLKQSRNTQCLLTNYSLLGKGSGFPSHSEAPGMCINKFPSSNSFLRISVLFSGADLSSPTCCSAQHPCPYQPWGNSLAPCLCTQLSP